MRGNKPIVALRFDDPTRDIDSRITFTRGSQATYFDSTGTLKFAPSNMIRNNTMVGAVAGTPGTAPTNWFISPSAGVTSSVVGTGTENDVTYIDVRFNGTPSATATCVIGFETAIAIAALTGQTWTNSTYLKLAAGSLTNITGVNLGIIEYTSGGVFVAGAFYPLSSPTSAALSTQRQSATRTLSGGATVAAVQPNFTVGVTNGLAVDITLRIGLPQLQLGSDATPAIRTSGSAVYLPRSNAYQDYNPSTLAPLGFLIEEQRTNLLLQSADFGTSWGATNTTVTTNSIASPDGGTNADTIAHTAVGGAINQTTQAFTAGSTVTFSVFAKKNASNFLRFEIGNLVNCWFNLNTGATATNNAGSGNVLFSAKSIQAINNGWYRCVVTVTTTTVTTLGCLLWATNTDNNTSSNGSSVYLWGAQAEVGAFATSYIATTTAAATRLADSASITGGNFSQWYNQTEGTIFGQLDLLTASAVTGIIRGILTADDNSINNRVGLLCGSASTTIDCRISSGGSAANPSSIGSISTSPQKMAIAYKAGASNGAAVLGGGTVQTSSPAGSVPADRFRIGNTQNGTDYLNGHIQRLSYYRARLSNATLQSLTS